MGTPMSPRHPVKLHATRQEGEAPRRTQSARQKQALARQYTIVAGPDVEKRLYRGVPGRRSNEYELTKSVVQYTMEETQVTSDPNIDNDRD
jgi:hypothetical protein